MRKTCLPRCPWVYNLLRFVVDFLSVLRSPTRARSSSPRNTLTAFPLLIFDFRSAKYTLLDAELANIYLAMEMIAFNAILFPSDGRPPHLVALMTSPVSGIDPHCVSSRQTRMPHPEVHIDYIAEGLGSRAWQYHVR